MYTNLLIAAALWWCGDNALVTNLPNSTPENKRVEDRVAMLPAAFVKQ